MCIFSLKQEPQETEAKKYRSFPFFYFSSMWDLPVTDQCLEHLHHNYWKNVSDLNYTALSTDIRDNRQRYVNHRIYARVRTWHVQYKVNDYGRSYNSPD